MQLLCLTCGTEIDAEPVNAFSVLVATCPRSDGEGVPPCDLLQVAHPAPPPPAPKES
ncbi:MAG TPA: hypothetical protein VNN99_14440 [Vicinamibacterales bacterium]|nr:hypothetical protein [Vicinamibacterales bacterium]